MVWEGNKSPCTVVDNVQQCPPPSLPQVLYVGPRLQHQGKSSLVSVMWEVENQKREDLMAQGHLTQALFGCGTQRLDS